MNEVLKYSEQDTIVLLRKIVEYGLGLMSAGNEHLELKIEETNINELFHVRIHFKLMGKVLLLFEVGGESLKAVYTLLLCNMSREALQSRIIYVEKQNSIL